MWHKSALNRCLITKCVFSAFCMQKFPGVTKGQLGVAVNGKLTELRVKAKKPALDANAMSDALDICNN
jgi:hypothetical protein